MDVYISRLRVSHASEHLHFTSSLYSTFFSAYLLPWNCITEYNECIQYVYCCSNLQIWFFSNTSAGSSHLYAGYEGCMTQKDVLSFHGSNEWCKREVLHGFGRSEVIQIKERKNMNQCQTKLLELTNVKSKPNTPCKEK